MPTRTSDIPPPRPDRPGTPANPPREVRGFHTRRQESAVNPDTPEDTSLDNTRDDNINTNGSER
jgi:hypothetical protein